MIGLFAFFPAKQYSHSLLILVALGRGKTIPHEGGPHLDAGSRIESLTSLDAGPRIQVDHHQGK